MKTDFDIAVIGSGFAGSLTALIARRLGHSVVLIERGRHPRFVIGESSTPLTNLLLEQLADEFDLEFLKPFFKWGTWQATHPEIGCGLKRGFTFLKHERDRPFAFRDDRANELLVAASPHDRIADTHWYRPDFDQFLQQRAVAAGVEYLDECEVNAVTWNARPNACSEELWARGLTLNLFHQGGRRDLKARFVIDASGPRGCLWKLLELDEAPLAHLPDTQSVFSHFTGVDELAWPSDETPYPPESAAVHHVFDEGWIWVLRFNNGRTSAGAVLKRDAAEQMKLSAGRSGWENVLNHLPTVKELFRRAVPVEPFCYLPNVSFRSLQTAGPGWALLPSAAGFVDPLLSTGFPLTLLGVQRLAAILRNDIGSLSFRSGLANYAETAVRELDLTGRLIAALYWNLDDFPLFSSLTRLYFAAAGFAESAWRLGRAELAPGFLLLDHPEFAPGLRRIVDRAVDHGQMRRGPGGSQSLQKEIQEIIAPVDVIGIGDLGRRNWHGADSSDLLRNRSKLNASEAEIRGLIRRCGL